LFNSKKILTTMMVLMIVTAAGSALAGAKIKVSDDAYIELGYRLQTYWRSMDADIDPDTDGFETMDNFSLRRARFRGKAVVTDKVSFFLQTDVSGKDMKMIDAFITYKANPWAAFIFGRNMAPASRQQVTSSAALMTMDRPGLVYKSLNWGTRYKYGFNKEPYAGSGISSGTDAVRDNGLTLFGSGDAGSGHFKYYAGVYNGTQALTGVSDKEHFSFRGQYNIWDAEGGYYGKSTYLGKKKTLGVGVSYSTQSEVAEGATSGLLVDYAHTSADIFLELPSSNGNSLSWEAAWIKLDFSDAVDYMDNQGTGYYTQLGYYLASGFQPWFAYESFSSDGAADGNGKIAGDFTSTRFGVTYFIDGHAANIKLGFESFSPDQPIMAGATEESTVNTITLGFFTNR